MTTLMTNAQPLRSGDEGDAGSGDHSKTGLRGNKKSEVTVDVPESASGSNDTGGTKKPKIGGLGSEGKADAAADDHENASDSSGTGGTKKPKVGLGPLRH